MMTVCVGQCGIQMGCAIWQQYCAEHFIDPLSDYFPTHVVPGYLREMEAMHHIEIPSVVADCVSKYKPWMGYRGNQFNPTDDDGTFDTFFEETSSGKFVSRNLMVDLEPNVIDDVKKSRYSTIYDTDFLLAGQEDAGNIFARGHNILGKEMFHQVNDRLRKLADHCDNLQGFIINHSVGGGTGSGLGARILERFSVDYRKKSKVQ